VGIPTNPYVCNNCFTLIEQLADVATGYTCRQTMRVLAVTSSLTGWFVFFIRIVIFIVNFIVICV